MKLLFAALLTFFIGESVWAAPLIIEKQGSFAAGGSIIEARNQYDPLRPTPESQTLHGDHANVFYQIPARVFKVNRISDLEICDETYNERTEYELPELQSAFSNSDGEKVTVSPLECINPPSKTSTISL